MIEKGGGVVMYLSRSMTSSVPSLYCKEGTGGMEIPSTAFGYGSLDPISGL